MKKSINFILILIIFELSINIMVYFDVVEELIQRDAVDCYSSIEEICVKIDSIYWDIFGIFIFAFFPSWLLSYFYSKLKKSKLWIIVIMPLFSWVWVYITYIIIGDYTSQLGHTWLDEEVWAFIFGQEHYWVAYSLASLAMFGLGYLNIKEGKQ